MTAAGFAPALAAGGREPMWRAAAPVGPLLASLAILLLGNGLQNILLPTRAARAGFDSATIGLVFSAYFAAFVMACFVAPRIIRKIGHARTFAAMAAIAAASGTAYAFAVHPLAWAALRAVSGFSFAILFVVSESWLNEKSSNANRGRILSLYRITDLSMSTCGQFLIGLADPDGFQLFSLFAMLIGLAAVPVLLSARPGPRPVGLVRLRPLALWRAAPAGITGCFAVGLGNGALWSLAPVFAERIGMIPTEAAAFMSAIIVGGALAQWPSGWWSDLISRRGVLIAAGFAASLFGIGLAVAPAGGQIAVLIAALLFGAAAMPLYTLSLAVVNDRVGPTDFVAAAATLLLIYALGATVGPLVAGFLMTRFGPAALFAYTAIVHGGAGAFVLYRVFARPQAADAAPPSP